MPEPMSRWLDLDTQASVGAQRPVGAGNVTLARIIAAQPIREVGELPMRLLLTVLVAAIVGLTALTAGAATYDNKDTPEGWAWARIRGGRDRRPQPALRPKWQETA